MKAYAISDRLREIAKLLDMNQTEMRERLKMSKSTFSNYWNGKREPKQNVISYIAAEFNISEAWLMGYEVPMHEPDYSDENAELVVQLSNEITSGGTPRNVIELMTGTSVIRKYFSLDEDERKQIDNMIEFFYNKKKEKE